MQKCSLSDRPLAIHSKINTFWNFREISTETAVAAQHALAFFLVS
jgi:hypothetical protein